MAFCIITTMVESIVSYEDFSKICRLCFGKDALKSILSIPEYSYNLKTITNIKVTKNDELPKFVCVDCIRKLNDVKTFIEDCRSNDAILKTILFQEKDKMSLCHSGINVSSDIKTEEIQVKLEGNDDVNRSIITVKIIKDENSSNELKLDTNKKREMFDCWNCEKVFSSKILLRRHMKNHRKGKLQQNVKNRNEMSRCTYCNKYFTRKSDMQRHLRIHTGIKPFTCTLCNKKFTWKNSLVRHSLLHTGNLQCIVCKTPFTTENQLKLHIKIHNNEEIKSENYKESLNSLKCDFCSEIFSSKSYLEGHRRLHTGIKNFERYLSHTEMNAFQCDQCEAAFNQSMLLERHKKVHDEHSEKKRRLTCNECGKYFLFPCRLKHHMSLHDLDQKPLIYKNKCRARVPGQFLCSYCGKQFNQVSNFKVHVRIHTGERFTCNICNNTYSTQDALKTHLLAHRGEKPFLCPYCGKRFRRPSLYRHLRIHRNIRMFNSDICKSSCGKASMIIKRHIKK